MSLEQTLYNVLKDYPDSHFIIAYSGGIDSQVLLHALLNLTESSGIPSRKINNTISVCHVNHGLSQNAHKWELFAQQQCDLRNIPLDICRVNVKNKAQHSLEELARNARYNAIKELVREQNLKHTIVLTGHHSDDQAETFLLALKRGSGVKGLSAMHEVMNFESSQLLRPLLHTSRIEVEAYATENKLEWIDDESNEDTRFDRNFFRHKVMPVINERWPSFLKTINRSVEHCQEADLLLTELAQQDLANIKVTDNCLSLEQLKTLSQPRFVNLIRYFLSCHQSLMPSTAQLKQLHKQLFADADKAPAVKLGNCWLRRYKKDVYLTAELNDISNVDLCVKDALAPFKNINVSLPDNLGKLTFKDETDAGTSAEYIVCPKPSDLVSIRFSHDNPTCKPSYRQRSRSLKKLLQELDIPTWERKRLPFLYYNGTLVAVIGYFICKEFVAAKSDEAISVNWLK